MVNRKWTVKPDLNQGRPPTNYSLQTSQVTELHKLVALRAGCKLGVLLYIFKILTFLLRYFLPWRRTGHVSSRVNVYNLTRGTNWRSLEVHCFRIAILSPHFRLSDSYRAQRLWGLSHCLITPPVAAKNRQRKSTMLLKPACVVMQSLWHHFGTQVLVYRDHRTFAPCCKTWEYYFTFHNQCVLFVKGCFCVNNVDRNDVFIK